MRVETPIAIHHAKQRRALAYIRASLGTILREGMPEALSEKEAQFGDELVLIRDVAGVASGFVGYPDTPALRGVFKDFDLVIRDERGGVHCPCGSVTGKNLRNELPPLVPCPRCRH